MAVEIETNVCVGCGARFARSANEKPNRFNKRRYCTKQCYGDSQRGVRRNAVQEIAECSECGRTFWRVVGQTREHCRDPECQSRRLLARMPAEVERVAQERIAEFELPRLIEDQAYDMRWGHRVVEDGIKTVAWDEPVAPHSYNGSVYGYVLTFADVVDSRAHATTRRSIRPVRRPKRRFAQDQSRVSGDVQLRRAA